MNSSINPGCLSVGLRCAGSAAAVWRRISESSRFRRHNRGTVRALRSAVPQLRYSRRLLCQAPTPSLFDLLAQRRFLPSPLLSVDGSVLCSLSDSCLHIYFKNWSTLLESTTSTPAAYEESQSRRLKTYAGARRYAGGK